MITENHPPFRTKTIGVRVTADDFEQLRSFARAQGKSLSEWCRDVLLRVARHPEGNCFEQAMLGETMALRNIVTQVTYYLASGFPITSTTMKAIWKEAEESKRGKALNLLRQVHADEEGGPPPQEGRNPR
jgi:hypothetical protein